MNENKDYLLLRVSYDRGTMIDDETLQECYDGDITKWLKEFLVDDGKFAFIDCFDLEDVVEENELINIM